MANRFDHRWWLAFVAHYIRDLIYGANDGIITTFAVVAGVRGAGLSNFTILALGFANLAADGLSMAVGDYHATKSEDAVTNQNGYHSLSATRHGIKHGAATWAAFTVAGLIPLLPYFVNVGHAGQRFQISIIMTAAALFAIGASRTWVTRRSAFWSGLEVLLIGALAGAVAFLTGLAVASIEQG